MFNHELGASIRLNTLKVTTLVVATMEGKSQSVAEVALQEVLSEEKTQQAISQFIHSLMMNDLEGRRMMMNEIEVKCFVLHKVWDFTFASVL